MAVFLLSMALIVCMSTAAAAMDRILVVQSNSIFPYEQAVSGFSHVCPVPLTRVFLSDPKPPTLPERISRVRPNLILAVGLDALNALASVHDIPIVYMMLICPTCSEGGRANLTGVDMMPDAKVLLGKIRKILPDIHRIGVVFDPEQSGRFVRSAIAAAGPLKLDILAKSVHSAREVPAKLLEMRGQVQLIWMIPDITVLTRQTIDYFMLFSLENDIPLATFSNRYIHMGALMAFELDTTDMGRQAGEMANAILSGTSPGKVPVQNARSVTVTVNKTVAKKFGVRIGKDLPKTVEIVR